MKKKIRKITFFIGTALLGVLLFTNCSEDDLNNFFNSLDDVLGEDGDVESLFGWLESDEDMDNIENDIHLEPAGGSGSANPTKVDLTNQFPPIGNQGAYGTCVAWAVGYNLKSFLEAKDKGYTTSDLSSPGNHFSPKDLFLSIGANDRGSDCNGTGFEVALDVLLERGIATMATVPYDNLGDCSQSPSSSGTSEAGGYKISSYRKIGESGNMDVDEIKDYLANGRAVVIGARLGDNFMQWSDDAVISSDTYNDPGMQHAYHAMVLSGYDDSKGAGGAFRVTNSWATSWGDDGYIWVDYDFFADEFCFAAFVATNTLSNPDKDGDNVVDDDNLTSGKDLVAWELAEMQHTNDTCDLARKITYNVFNVGDETIYATDRWNILYVYYNAYDAEDYGIVLFDYYSDEFGDYGDDGPLKDMPVSSDYLVGVADNWYSYVDVESGQSAAAAVYNDPESRYSWQFDMPSTNESGYALTGNYYLVLIADGFDVVSEYDETNNYYFLTDADGNAPYLVNGVPQSELFGINKKKSGRKNPAKNAASPSASPVNKNNSNTYKPHEIINMLEHHKKTGELQEKVEKFLRKNSKAGSKGGKKQIK